MKCEVTLVAARPGALVGASPSDHPSVEMEIVGFLGVEMVTCDITLNSNSLVISDVSDMVSGVVLCDKINFSLL